MWLEGMLEALLIADFYIVCGRCAHEGYQLRGSVESVPSHAVKKCCANDLSCGTGTAAVLARHQGTILDHRYRMAEQEKSVNRRCRKDTLQYTSLVTFLVEFGHVPGDGIRPRSQNTPLVTLAAPPATPRTPATTKP